MAESTVDDSRELNDRVARAIQEEEAVMPENVAVGREMFRRLAEVGALLRSSREAEGLDLDQLSARTGLDEVLLEQVEEGRSTVTLEVIDRYAAGLGRAVALTLVAAEDGNGVAKDPTTS